MVMSRGKEKRRAPPKSYARSMAKLWRDFVGVLLSGPLFDLSTMSYEPTVSSRSHKETPSRVHVLLARFYHVGAVTVGADSLVNCPHAANRNNKGMMTEYKNRLFLFILFLRGLPRNHSLKERLTVCVRRSADRASHP
jgi:hypothetical protein